LKIFTKKNFTEKIFIGIKKWIFTLRIGVDFEGSNFDFFFFGFFQFELDNFGVPRLNWSTTRRAFELFDRFEDRVLSSSCNHFGLSLGTDNIVHFVVLLSSLDFFNKLQMNDFRLFIAN
jgi:hypothetical protein